MTREEARALTEEILDAFGRPNLDIDWKRGFHRDYYEDTIEDAFSSMKSEVCWGASKCVIVPAEFDYVIKIPFNCEGWRDNVDDSSRFTCAEYCLTGETGEDYCRAEAEVYTLAKEKGLEDFFAETIFAMEYCGLPLYLQPKCEDDEDSKERTSKIETLESADAADFSQSYNSASGMSDEMIFNFLVDYGEARVNELFNFLDSIQASDFHDGNWAFLNKRAVLIDYSSFREGWC